jgi:transcriptional regulator with XRE-family HTH domain
MEPDLRSFCVAVGKRVQQLRLERHLTQEDMGDHGFVVRHYQRIEAGRSVTLRTVWKLARAFGVPVREIFPVDGKAPSATRKGRSAASRTSGRRAPTGRAKRGS